MPRNAAGLDVSGANNPKWKGGLIDKVCAICGKSYRVKPVHGASRFCSLKCVGVSQRGLCRVPPAERRMVEQLCEVCGSPYFVPSAHAKRHHCCSRNCSHKRRSLMSRGEKNPSWAGGVSRLPYPWNFRDISRGIIERDGHKCQSPYCAGQDRRLTTHHINYDKTDCRPGNLICLCSACNSKANFRRNEWAILYREIMRART
jgi:hypothetical protein